MALLNLRVRWGFRCWVRVLLRLSVPGTLVLLVCQKLMPIDWLIFMDTEGDEG